MERARIYRVSDVKPDLERAYRELGWRVAVKTTAMLEVKRRDKVCVIDVKEHTGPVYKRDLEQWIRNYPHADWLILITMGFFAPDSYRFVLASEERVRKVALVSLGLRDYFDQDFRPMKLVASKPSELFRELENVIGKWGLRLRSVPCNYCNRMAIIFCRECDVMLCRDHFIPCPVCHVKLCHPDVNRCFFAHECR